MSDAGDRLGPVGTLVVGLDIGGTNTDACLVAPDLPRSRPVAPDLPRSRPVAPDLPRSRPVATASSIVAVETRPTDASGGHRVVATAAAAVTSLLDAAGVAPSRIGAIGVGIAGHVDHTAGTVRHAVNLGIDGAPFGVRDALRARLGVPVVVDNDVRAAAVGAFHHLQASTGHDLRSLVYLGVGTGLSAGVILDGRLHRGRNNLAGEIGHVPAMAGGPPCRCGMVGCLEAVAAGPALKRAWPRGAGDLFRAAGAGDAGAGRIAEAFALPLARAVMWLTATYDPDVVVLGGGVGSASPLAAALVAAALRSLASGSELAGDVFAGGRLQSLDSDLPVGALGAATLALELISLPSDARQAEQAIQEEETNP